MEYIEQVCWKCGKKLNTDNQSNLVYTSNLPQYTCKDCDEPIKYEIEIKGNTITTKPILQPNKQ